MTIAEAERFYKQDTKNYEIEKNIDFLNWLKISIANGYNCFIDTKELQELIDNIVTWYEIKYPERELEYFEGTRDIDFQNIKRISNIMSIRQLLYRLPHNQLCLIECGYRAKGWGQHQVYEKDKKVSWKTSIFMRINRKKAEETNLWLDRESYFLLHADHTTGKVLVDYNLKEYIDNNPGTSKNKYTGIFKDKNLVFVVAESFSTIGVREDLTPTLYKLTNNGFVFNNYYVPYFLSTIGGEFQADTALYPSINSLSIWRSGNNSFPYGLGNSFNNINYNTYAYHNHSGYFQDRYKYLKAIGFNNFKACAMGLDINCDVWPESDIEMIEKTYTDYIDSDKPFMAYYMTVSGHMEYNFFGNNIASKNKSLVDNLNLSTSASAYLATQIELDRALELLINRLEEANKLDDTVIILTADHYPYALSLEEMNELSTFKRDNLFEINHNSLIIWNNKLNRVEIDKVGMSIDVLPTVYNLFGIEYDSCLFAGTDLLSNSEGLVILSNRSWITDKGKYNSITNEYIGIGDVDYVNNINKTIQNKISFSRSMITNNGYKYIKIKEK